MPIQIHMNPWKFSLSLLDERKYCRSEIIVLRRVTLRIFIYWTGNQESWKHNSYQLFQRKKNERKGVNYLCRKFVHFRPLKYIENEVIQWRDRSPLKQKVMINRECSFIDQILCSDFAVLEATVGTFCISNRDMYRRNSLCEDFSDLKVVAIEIHISVNASQSMRFIEVNGKVEKCSQFLDKFFFWNKNLKQSSIKSRIVVIDMLSALHKIHLRCCRPLQLSDLQ